MIRAISIWTKTSCRWFSHRATTSTSYRISGSRRKRRRKKLEFLRRNVKGQTLKFMRPPTASLMTTFKNQNHKLCRQGLSSLRILRNSMELLTGPRISSRTKSNNKGWVSDRFLLVKSGVCSTCQRAMKNFWFFSWVLKQAPHGSFTSQWRLTIVSLTCQPTSSR